MTTVQVIAVMAAQLFHATDNRHGYAARAQEAADLAITIYNSAANEIDKADVSSKVYRDSKNYK